MKKTMKKYSILLGAAFSLFALASCQKEVDVNIPENDNSNKHIPFVLKADVPETRTTIDAETWEMAWENGDVIYAVTTDEEWGHAWVSNEQSYIETIAEFTYDGEGFSTTKEISEGNHTFNFLYTGGTQKSYHRGAGSTFQLYTNQEMDAQAPTANLKVYDALAGQVTAKTPTTFVNVSMAHLFTLMKVTLKNKTGADITANKFEISAEGANLYGVFNITFGNAPAAAFNKNGGNQINVTITNGTIANGENLDVFFVMAPLNEYSGDITFKVIDSNGNTYTKKNTVAGVTFSAGKYNTASYTLKTADPLECVNLDWTYPTGDAAATSAGIQAQPGVTAEGLGSDYADGNAPYRIKFDNTGDYIQIHTDKAIGQVSVKYKMIGGGNTSKLEIYESTLGTEWSKVEDLTISGAANSTGELTTTRVFSTASRFVKIVFNKGSNVGIGGISITKANTDPYIYAEDIAVSALGVESDIATYEARNFEDDVIVPEVNGFTGCVSEAYAEDGEIIYCVEPNYTTSPVSGTIVLCSQSNPSVTKTINVTQEASVFEASSTDAMAFAWNDKTNSEEKSVTITSTFALTKTDNVVLSGTNADKFSVSLTPVSNSTDEYTLSVSVNEDNESEADYEAVVTISRNDLAIVINLSQAKHPGEGPSGLSASWVKTSGSATSTPLASSTGNTSATLSVTNSNGNKLSFAGAGIYSQNMSSGNYWLLTIPNVSNVTADTEVSVVFSGVKKNKDSAASVVYQFAYSWDNTTWTNVGSTYSDTATATSKAYTFKPGKKASGTLYVRYYVTSGGATGAGSHYLGSINLSAE